MAFEFREQHLEKEEIDQRFQRQFQPYPATLTTVTGSSDGTSAANVQNREGYVWARLWGDLSPSQVLNRGSHSGDKNAGVSPSIAGFPVSLGYRDSGAELEVLSVLTSTLPPSVNYIPGDYQNGADLITRRRLTMLRTEVGSGLTVNVSSLEYDRNGTRVVFGGQNGLDLAASVPGAGLARWVLVYLNSATNTLGFLNGDTVPDNSPFINPIKPNTPVEGYASAYVRLANGQTTITDNEIDGDIDDGRRFLTIPLTTEQPTSIGQVLFSIDGISWTRETPVTNDRWGWLVGDSGRMVVEG